MPYSVKIKRTRSSMETKERLVGLINEYSKAGEAEKIDSEPLMDFVINFEGYDLIDRKNFTGHITASAFIVNENNSALLLLKHKSLNRWLQPGGHVDAADATIYAAAYREACEETGVAPHDLTLLSDIIFDIDSHHIPANNKKSEPAHVHHDIRFLFRCGNSTLLNISLEESTDSRWVPFGELHSNADFNWVEEKIKAFI